MTILVDTREQRPYWPSNRRTLNVGDYTTESLLGKFHIERKSLQDLYGTLIHNHPRFRREIIRAEERGTVLVVVVEGSHDDFINKRFPKGDQRKCTKEVLTKIVATVRRRYKLEIIFCSNRERAKKKTLSLLKAWEKTLSTRRRPQPQSVRQGRTPRRSRKQ